MAGSRHAAGRIAVATIAAAAAVSSLRGLAQFRSIPPAGMPAGTATISGTVVTEIRTPAAGAAVSLHWRADPSPDEDRRWYSDTTTTTDRRGRFVFRNVTPHAVELSASSAGFVPTTFGATSSGLPGTPIRLDAGEQASFVLTLSRGVSIAGTVTDDGDRPVTNALVEATRLRPGSGDAQWFSASTAEVATDVRGAYRIPNVPPGRYVVGARVPAPPGIVGPVFAETGGFYRDVRNPDLADPIVVGPMTNVTGIDLHLRAPALEVITGVVLDARGQPIAGVTTALSLPGYPTSSAETTTGADGRFTVQASPEQYAVVASLNGAWDRAEVVANHGVVMPLTLRLKAGGIVRVSGVALDFHPEFSETFDSLSFHLTLVQGDAHYDASGSRTMFPKSAFMEWTGVPPGHYMIEVNASGLREQSEMVDGRDAFDFPFEVKGGDTHTAEITMTRRSTWVTGSVIDGQGRPSLDHSVIICAADERFWTPRSRRILVDRPDTHGHYQVTGLPAGEYIAALAPPDLYGAPSQSLLHDLARTSTAVLFTLHDGERIDVNLDAR